MAFIVFNQRYKGKLSQVVSATKAKEINHFLNNPPDDLTDEQSEFLLAIHKIYMGNKKVRKESENTLYHEGRLQGKSEMLPTGDR